MSLLSLADLDNPSERDVLAEEIAENLENVMGSFREVIRQMKLRYICSLLIFFSFLLVRFFSAVVKES
jgi:hypothetical protein